MERDCRSKTDGESYFESKIDRDRETNIERNTVTKTHGRRQSD